MTIFLAVATVVITSALALRRLLTGWRASRRSAWDLDRAAWRRWMVRP